MSRYIPLLRIVVVVLVIAAVVLGAALVWTAMTGTQAAAPRTELERGLAAAEEAVKANPDNPTARVKLAAAYVEQKQYNAAVEQAQAALRIAPEDPSGYYVLGLAQVGKGDRAVAIVSLTKATTLKGQQAPFYQDAYVALARAQAADGDLDAAIDSISKAIDKGPENSLLLFERGQLYEQTGDWFGALQNLDWALGYTPDYQPARDAFARISTAHPEALEKLKNSAQTTTTTSPSAQATTSTTAGK